MSNRTNDQVPPLRVRVHLGAMAKKWYFTCPKSPRMKPRHQIMSYLGHSLERRRLSPSAEILSVYSTAPTNWTTEYRNAHCRIKYWYLLLHRLIGLVGSVFANGPGDLGSIPGRVIPKNLKMVLGTSLLNTQQYKVRIKGKVEQSRERSSALLYASV